MLELTNIYLTMLLKIPFTFMSVIFSQDSSPYTVIFYSIGHSPTWGIVVLLHLKLRFCIIHTYMVNFDIMHDCELQF